MISGQISEASQWQSVYLICGGAGFIGSHFVECLIKEDKPVIVLDAFTYAGHLENLQMSFAHNGRLLVLKGNIEDVALVREIFKKADIQTIVNFAAESHVDRSIVNATDFVQTNIVGTHVLLKLSLEYWRGLSPQRQRAFRYIQISTDEVFGSLAKNNGKFNENSPYHPNSPYAASKASADFLVHSFYHTHGLPCLITHSSNNYGPRQYPEKLIPYAIHRSLADRSIPLYGTGENVRDWIYVTDHCRAIDLAHKFGELGHHYLFGGDCEITNKELVQRICHLLDHKKPRKNNRSYLELIDYVRDRPGHDLRYAIDNSDSQKYLGFSPQKGIAEGLDETVSWYLDQENRMQEIPKI